MLINQLFDKKVLRFFNYYSIAREILSNFNSPNFSLLTEIKKSFIKKVIQAKQMKVEQPFVDKVFNFDLTKLQKDRNIILQWQLSSWKTMQSIFHKNSSYKTHFYMCLNYSLCSLCHIPISAAHLFYFFLISFLFLILFHFLDNAIKYSKYNLNIKHTWEKL